VLSWGNGFGDWYVHDAHVYDTLVHSHLAYLEAIVRGGTECCLARVSGLRVTDTDLRDGVPGAMSGATSGWIWDPWVVGGPRPLRFSLIDLGHTAWLALRVWDLAPRDLGFEYCTILLLSR
jgi:hypothetical protein